MNPRILEPYLFQPFLESHGAQEDRETTQNNQGQHLRPENIQSIPLQKDTPDDNEKVS